jgi:menaquinone-dependent protoporphyrinogen oxidase
MKTLICILLTAVLTQFAFTGESITGRTLIVYGSFQGSTKEIAGKMKTILETKGIAVDIMPAENKKMDLSKYNLVIIGSAIHGGSPHPAILQFIKRNAGELSKKNTAVFVVCITIVSSKTNLREAALHYPEKVAVGFIPVSSVVFAGTSHNGGWFGNWIGKTVLGITPGDFRDWKKIEDWTLAAAKYAR